MPRKIFECSTVNPYHITGTCLNRDWLECPIEFVWEVMSEELFFIHHAYSINILSFVLMSNHYHLLALSQLGNLSAAIGALNSRSAQRITKQANRVHGMWAGRFHRSEIQSFRYFENVYRYVYQNPLRAGIVDFAEEYQFSTLSGKLGQNHLLIPVSEDTILFSEGHENTLRWLNTRFNPQDENSMRLALRRKVFEYPKILGLLNPLERLDAAPFIEKVPDP